ncbi:MAG: butyrate kinase [Desulfobacteraceae bacterium]|jgi:butyrate kinase
MFQMIVINIGSTSTKLGLFWDQEALVRKTVEHSPDKLSRLNVYDAWLRFHQDAVDRILKREKTKLGKIDLVVSRGGLTKPIEGGAYRINEDMLRDLRSGAYGSHPANIGPHIAHRLAERYGVEAIIYDAPVANEFIPISRFSGLKGIERRSAIHVLSQKSAVRKAAHDLHIPLAEANFIVAHLGGGITIGAHRKGRIIDGTHGLSEGPFTPQRAGALPVLDVVELCFSEKASKEELNKKLFGQGGVYSYLETHDMEAVEARISEGDKEALLVSQAMAYQISKDICSMAAALEGHINAVVLTGNLCRAKTLINEIRKRISFLGKVMLYPGEDELESLALGGYLVLTQAEKIKEYS